MSQNSTPILMNVKECLKKIDFYMCLTVDCVWPWPVTHFVRRNTCYMCGTSVAVHARQHIVVVPDEAIRAQLLDDPNFWCHNCSYCLYRHLKPNDCYYCCYKFLGATKCYTPNVV